MKHSQWLRLKAEGENICSILRQQGYRCTKQVRRLSWKITAEGVSYVLTWLPAPVGDWSIIPNDSSPARQKLMLVVQDRLKEAERMLPLPDEGETPASPSKSGVETDALDHFPKRTFTAPGLQE